MWNNTLCHRQKVFSMEFEFLRACRKNTCFMKLEEVDEDFLGRVLLDSC